MSESFEFRILVGTSRRPAVLRPARNEAQFDGIKSRFTGYTNVKRTYLYFKGKKLKQGTCASSRLFKTDPAMFYQSVQKCNFLW